MCSKQDRRPGVQGTGVDSTLSETQESHIQGIKLETVRVIVNPYNSF